MKGAHTDTKTNITGQIYTWMLSEQDDKLGKKYIQMRDNAQTRGTTGSLTINFEAQVYDPSKLCWVQRQKSISVQRKDVMLVGTSTVSAVMTDGAAAVSVAAALKIKEVLGLKALPGQSSVLSLDSVSSDTGL